MNKRLTDEEIADWIRDDDGLATIRSDGPRVCRRAMDELVSLRADLAALRNEHNALQQFIEGVRHLARDRNPKGKTILDFMVAWNEQYEETNRQLKSELTALREPKLSWHPDDDVPEWLIAESNVWGSSPDGDKTEYHIEYGAGGESFFGKIGRAHL